MEFRAAEKLSQLFGTVSEVSSKEGNSELNMEIGLRLLPEGYEASAMRRVMLESQKCRPTLRIGGPALGMTKSTTKSALEKPVRRLHSA
jgi:hypothetical protein